MNQALLRLATVQLLLFLLSAPLCPAQEANVDPGCRRATATMRSVNYTLHLGQKASAGCSCCTLFSDGFESGDLSRWSASIP